MGFLESLNKIGVEIPLAKTQLYQEIESHRSFFEKMGLSSRSRLILICFHMKLYIEVY